MRRKHQIRSVPVNYLFSFVLFCVHTFGISFCSFLSVLVATGLHVVFMPHCEQWLYENFLAAHRNTDSPMGLDFLPRVVLIGNSFKVFKAPPTSATTTTTTTFNQQQEVEGQDDTAAGNDNNDGQQTEPQRGAALDYLKHHKETPLGVKPGHPYWVALSGLTLHQWGPNTNPGNAQNGEEESGGESAVCGPR